MYLFIFINYPANLKHYLKIKGLFSVDKQVF